MTIVIILFLSAVILFFFAGLYTAYHKVFYSPTKDMSETESPPSISNHPFSDAARQKTEELSRIPCEYVRTRSYDGLKLSARYYQGKSSKPLCICFHGYRGSAIRDFSGIGLFLIREGYSVLLVDQRAHWRSQGHTITFGIKERYDALSWIRYADRRFGKETSIYLFGISLGGGTVLMASGQELPKNVKGIVADCPFNSPKDIIRHVCRKINLNPDLCWPIVWLSGLIYGRFNISATTAAQEAKNTKVPILIIHGEGDDFVPPEMSNEVAVSNPSMIERRTFPEAGHGLCYYYYPDRYEDVIRQFITNTSAL
ncbi:MAG: alpha/beta hydrolase [Ruminococcus sp.]|nr:alpha/beta hydrolase [Ruminococcus sp.]